MTRALADDLADAVRRDPSTGFLYRRPLLEALNDAPRHAA